METVLHDVLTVLNASAVKDRPKVCLTWAQSLDGKLAVTKGKPTLISGNESMEMTHALRAVHDVILVGIGTLLSDDPRLSCRINEHTHQTLQQACVRHGHSLPPVSQLDPCPVVLDSALRISPTARCLRTKLSQQLQKPIVFCESSALSLDETMQQRRKNLNSMAQIVPVQATPASSIQHPNLSVPSILQSLRQRGVGSVMVEGGASVISSFLDAGLWDVAVVTVAPTLFRGGVSLDTDAHETKLAASRFSKPRWTPLGDDVVVVGRPM